MADIGSFKDIEELVQMGFGTPICGTNEDGETVIISQGRTEEGLGRSFLVETFQKNGWSCIHTYWEDGTKEERFKKNDDDGKPKVVAASGGEAYFLTDDECFSLFGAIECRLRQMEDTIEEPSAKKDGRYEAALVEIEMLKSIEKTLGF